MCFVCARGQVERFLAIRFPLKIGALCTRRRSMMTLVLLFVCVMALNIIYPVAAKDQINGNDWICIFGKGILNGFFILTQCSYR